MAALERPSCSGFSGLRSGLGSGPLRYPVSRSGEVDSSAVGMRPPSERVGSDIVQTNSQLAALCPISMTWADDTARMTPDRLAAVDRLVAIDPQTGMPGTIASRSVSGWGDVITASEWPEESQRLAEECISRLTPMRFTIGGVPASGNGRRLAEWAPCVMGRDIADDGSIHIDLMLTCLEDGEHFGETMAAAIRVGWETSECRSVTGLYELARTAASIHAEAFDPDWAEAMFVRRSALRVARSAEKRLPDPITWADANAALNSRSRLLASRYGITDIRATALGQAESDGLLKRVKGGLGPGSKWKRTSKPIPENISGGRWSRS